ncbi:MAG: hypothetical protein ACI840_002426, partial [Ulvibacter sp.]
NRIENKTKMDRNSIVLFISIGIIAFASLKNTANITIFHKSKESTLTQVAELVKAKEMHALSHQSKEAFNHEAFNALLVANVSETGIVNYKGFVENKKLLEDYIALLGESLPTETWTIEDKLAYWMNAYNAMTIDLIIRSYPINSIKDLKKPWDQRLWKLGEKWYNLNEIEHQILRKMNDPRIHFGINCASFSCPPLLNTAFNASEVDAQLDKVAIRFINDPRRNSISKMNIEISEIFSWFAKDFKKDSSLSEFLNKYSKVQIHPKARKKFKKYDWSLNE